MTTRRRIQEQDCLAELRRSLEVVAKNVKPWDADRYPGWVEACADVLASVPDRLQRVAWAWSLAQALLKGIVGLQQDLVIGMLLKAADERGKAVSR
jgi:hypothetical protein